ncbi:MAG: NUDIX hydrolase [Candidatus Gracilibacteria bacterium]
MIHNIPENAKKVFQGTIFSVYQWEQKMFDGSTEIFECIVRPDTVTIIPVVGDKILVTHQKQPHRDWFYALPGGRVDEGEDHLVAAKREFIEETGYKSDDWSMHFSHMPNMSVRFIVSCYIAKNCINTGILHPDPGEKIETKLVSFDEFLEIGCRSDFRGSDIKTELQLAYYNEEKRRTLKDLLFS